MSLKAIVLGSNMVCIEIEEVLVIESNNKDKVRENTISVLKIRNFSIPLKYILISTLQFGG